MSQSYDVIVVGLGAMGAATCDHLARRGVRVLGLERFDLANTLGSSGGQTRLIRRAYFEHPDYVPLLRKAYRNWDVLSERSGVELFVRTGCLYLGPSAGELIQGTMLSAHEHQLQCDQLTTAAVEERFPAFFVPEHYTVLFEPEAGFLLCERALATFSDQALRAGADLRAREIVTSWHAAGSSVRVVTDRGEYSAGSLVLTAGAWAAGLLGDLGVQLQVTRQVMAWLWPKTPDRFALDRFTCWALEEDASGSEGIYYGFPLLPVDRFGGLPGIKVGRHVLGEETDPDDVDLHVSSADENEFRPTLRRYLPDADGPTLGAKVCLYTSTPDGHFVVDKHPVHDDVILACGFSGHGFKFASVIGEALADLATEGATELPIGFLGFGRFQKE